MNAPNEATLAQIRAAQPGLSTWLSANAGSGKTRVLTDRVSRLLLRDVPPQNILCLTFTKAAAAEMQNRLFARLGEWSMLDDEALAKALDEIGESGEADGAHLRKARRLFARAIETPGGLKIQTIHSFCSTVLRRFPLEAGVPPGFKELDDLTGKERLGEALDRVAQKDPGAFDAFAELFTGLEIESFASRLTSQREAYAEKADFETILAKLDLPAGFSEARLISDTFLGGERALITRLMPHLTGGSVSDAKTGAEFSALPVGQMALLALFDKKFVTQSGKSAGQAKIGSFPTKKTLENLPPDLRDQLEALMGRVEQAHDRSKRLRLAKRSYALHRFAHVFLPEYDAVKAARGELDFDDLILKTRDLLTREGLAEWVLFRLDGGIDHILVDEAQDTAPVQWQVIDLISREITSGSGTRESGERTIFVVGDKKQSIYGFQGADPDGFERMADTFTERLGQLGAAPQRLDLHYSFRSAAPILRVVDEAFPDAPPAMGGALNHIAFHDEMPGRVDLWPFLEKGERPEDDTPWFTPVDMVGEHDPEVKLGRQIAAEIVRIQAEERLFEQTGEGYRPRRIHDGDVLILVQRRAKVFHEVIRACKAAGLSVAGADRVKLSEALAVKDVLALLSFLVTPDDDLALASALHSPLFDWSEDDLYRLAAPRGGRTLWQALREHGTTGEPARAILSDLLNRADFDRPYELIDRILRTYDGRPRLLTRLGVEVEDSIDLLLSTALTYEQAETPSLTGFLAWMEASEVEIKRGQESGTRAIRVMTVHGAKGLESPIVILAESGDRRPPPGDGAVDLGEGMPPLWKPSKADMPSKLAPRFEALVEKQEEERLRLHYVAMTRAEQWLIVCGAGKAKEDGASFYRRTEEAMARVGAVDHSFAVGGGLRYENRRGGDLHEVADAPVSAERVTLPPFARTPAEIPERPLQILSPSSLPGPKTLPAEGAGDPDAMARGTSIHMLLEHLPLIAPAERAARGRALLEAVEPIADIAALEEALAVINAPNLAQVFSADALVEVAINASLPELDGRVMQGIIDRLIVTDTTVTAIDFKSNAVVPDRPEDTPAGLLAQLGAYASALSQIYPDHEIRTAILWTRAARLDVLPHNLVTNALKATASA